MPHITTAMHRSMRRSVGDIFFDSLLGRKRSITGEVSSVANTFSSWDNCMKQTYCKWPVIVGIIVGGLILLSILTCIIRCCCCGMSCCCSCFSFLKCCDCCGDCCEGKKNKPMKHLDEPFGGGYGGAHGGYDPHGGYKAPEPMMGGALGVRPTPTAAPPPQFAQFEVGKNGLAVEPKPAAQLSEDALPPMPSWDSAAKKHVLTEEEKNAVELGELDPVTGQKIPLMAGAAGAGISHPPSPSNGHSPYGPPPGTGVNGNGYMGVQDQYGQNQAAFNQNGRYGSPAPSQGGRGYGAGPQEQGIIGGQGYGRGPNSPRDFNGRGRGFGPQSPQDQYAQNDGYTDAGAGGAYGRPPPQRQFSNDQYSDNGRPFPPPNRQYSNESGRPMNPPRQYSDRSGYQDNFQPPRGPSRGPMPGQNRMASPPLNNNSGFDFGGGTPGYPQSRPTPPPQQYSSRPSPPPQQMSYGSSNPGRRPSPPQGGRNDGYFDDAPPSNYPSRTPPPQEPAYPGYRPYQPAAGQGGRGAAREPQGWDPVHQ